MTMATGGAVSNAVLATKLDALVGRIDDMAAEVRALRAEHVRRDLYDAHRAATDAELTRVREQCRTDTEELRRELDSIRGERAAMRRNTLVAFITGGLGVVAAIASALAG